MADFTIDRDAEALIKKLIGSQDESIDYDAITNEMLTGTGVALEDFWQQFIGFLQNEYKELGNHIPILESDFNGRDAHKTLFDFINENCDLSDDLIEQLKQKFQENGIDLSEQSGMNNSKDYFWNESMSKALALFLKEFDPTTYNEDESAYTGAAAAIKNADAAYSFDEDWVKPTEIDGNSYEDVRGVDAIESVLKNSSQMQFTRDKSSPWLRLIMPKYLRKVEVEDLNRNFWVISATLGAICDFLFGTEAPFKDLFEDIISELVQLWENVLYLWATIAALSHKESITEVHTEVIPISNSEIENYIKFDYFQVGKDAEDWEPDGMKSFLISQCKYLVDSYENCHLCLLPYLRINNYKHNYYSEELYPGILFYNRNTNNWTFLAIKNEQDDKYTVRIDAQEIIDDPILGGLTATIKENEFTYEFLYGAKKAELQNEPFYLLLRTDQTFSAHYEENTIIVDSFTVSARDISFTLRKNKHELIVKQFSKNDLDTWDSEVDGCVEVEVSTSGSVQDAVDQRLNPSSEYYDPNYYYNDGHKDDIETFNISKGFYRGEFPSYLVPLSARGLRIDIEDVLMVPFIADNWDEIVDYLQGKTLDVPQSLRECDKVDVDDKVDFQELEERVDKNNLVHSKNNDSRILDLYAKTQTQPNTLCLYRNNHQITFITIDNNLIKQPYDSSSSNDWYELKMSSPELELTDGFKKVEDPQNGNSYYVLNKVNNITYHDIEVFNETHEETDWPDDKESYYYIDANNNYIKVSENDEFDVNKVYYKSVQKETETTMPCIIGLDSYLYNYSNVATLYNAYTKSFTTYSKYEFYGYGQGWGTSTYSIIPGESPFNQEVYLYIPEEDRVLTKENWVLVIVDNQYSVLQSGTDIETYVIDNMGQEAWDNTYSSLFNQAVKCSDNPDKAESMPTKVYFRHTFHIFKADGKYCSMTYDRGWRGVQNKKYEENPCYNSEYPLNYWSKTYINDGQFNYDTFIQTIENDYKLLSKSGENILDYQHYPNTGFVEDTTELHIIDFNSTGD